MSSNFPKYAYTEKGVVIFSNCVTHDQAVNGVFGDVPILKKGFIEIKQINSNLDFELHKIVSEGEVDVLCDQSPEVREAINKLLFCEDYHAEYVLTYSRFVIFPAEFSYEDIVHHLFYDSVIKGAGNVVLEKDGLHGVKARSYGNSNIVVDGQKYVPNMVDEKILKNQMLLPE